MDVSTGLTLGAGSTLLSERKATLGAKGDFTLNRFAPGPNWIAPCFLTNALALGIRSSKSSFILRTLLMPLEMAFIEVVGMVDWLEVKG